MRIVLEQMVFPFLADDSAYQEAVREERTTQRVLHEVGDELEKRVSGLFEDRLDRLVENAVQRQYTEIVSDLGKIHLTLAQIHVALAEGDSADWWKQEYDDDEEDDGVL